MGGTLGDPKLDAGAGRIFILTVAADEQTDLQLLSNATEHFNGAMAFFSDTGRLFFCTDGLLDTWVELFTIGASSPVGTLTVGEELALSEDVTLATAKKLVVPEAESWLNDGTTDISPHSLASRLRDLVTAGTDGQEFDFLQGLMHAVTVQNTRLITSIPNGTTRSIAQLNSVDLTTRRGNSHFLVIGIARTTGGSQPAVNVHTAHIDTVIDTAAVPPGNSSLVNFWTQNVSTTGIVTARYITGIAAAGGVQEFFLTIAHTATGNALTIDTVQLILIDLGLDGT